MATNPTSSEKNWALFIHLSCFLGFVIPGLGLFAPILFWLAKRNESEFLDDQGREAANFTLTCFGSGLVLTILATVGLFALRGSISDADPVALIGGGVLTYALFIALGLIWMIGSIFAGLKASAGERYRHRFVIRIFKKG